MNRLVFDPNQKGLLTILNPWQIDLLDTIWNNPTEKFTTAELHKRNSHQISRASVINFCQDMAKEGYIGQTITDGKGGKRGLYFSNLARDEFLIIVKAELKTAIDMELK